MEIFQRKNKPYQKVRVLFDGMMFVPKDGNLAEAEGTWVQCITYYPFTEQGAKPQLYTTTRARFLDTFVLDTEMTEQHSLTK